MEKVRIHVFVPQEIANLLNRIALAERRTKSAIVELSLLDYGKKNGHPLPKSASQDR